MFLKSGVHIGEGSGSNRRDCSEDRFMLPSSMRSAEFRPARYHPDGLGAWSGHIPFVCDLISSFRPGLIVELGTYYGESYFAMCQAASESGVTCSACAVDTWSGDLHVGAYGSEVFDEVSAYNEARFCSFSTLLRMAFDDAVARFADGSIDLLHIDGLHTYEVVRHDFETWIRKVRPGGVVLLHDTAVRGGDFGVWRYWSELQQAYPAFAFRHSNGLGVLRNGEGAPNPLLDLLFGCGKEHAEAVRAYYELCADRLQYRDESERRASGLVHVAPRLYWRGHEDQFHESRAVGLRTTVGPACEDIRVNIPPIAPPPAELRLDLGSDRVALLISNLRLLGADGRELWAWCDKDTPVLAAMRLVPVGPRSFLAVTRGGEAALILPPEAHILQRLDGGGSLVAEMSSVDQVDCVARLQDQMREIEQSLSAARSFSAQQSEQIQQLLSTVRSFTSLQSEQMQQLRESRGRVTALENSLSWRITAPLRVSGALLMNAVRRSFSGTRRTRQDLAEAPDDRIGPRWRKDG